MAETQRLFVLDSSVLMHDPASLFRFQEHDIYIPMVVLEELDMAKTGMSEVSRNARQASRFMDELLSQHEDKSIHEGLQLTEIQFFTESPLLNEEDLSSRQLGRLYFQSDDYTDLLPKNLPGNKPDNHILSLAMHLAKTYPARQVTLVSKDINLRIKAHVVGLNAEDYFNDQALDDVDLLPTGIINLEADFWDSHSKSMESWQEDGRTFYTIEGEDVRRWALNTCLFLNGSQPFLAIVRNVEDNRATIEIARNYMASKNIVWGINARNVGQNFALNLLMDPEVDFISLMGQAGTGKTLLTLAAALAQTLDHNLYREIIMTRVTIPVGEDIGFLPGTEEEKMTPWMGALMDNLEVLSSSGNNPQGNWEREATNDLLKHKIKVRSLNFMRGRTFLNKFLIIDEAQNLTAKQMKTMIMRAGPGTKVVCLGNVGQIDTPYLTETTSGLTYVVDRFKNWQHSGHITLQQGERSRLADHASDIL